MLWLKSFLQGESSALLVFGSKFSQHSGICREEPMIPDEHDEVDMNDFDPENDRQNHR